MKCTPENTGNYLLLSDGSKTENTAINVIISLLLKLEYEFPEDDFGHVDDEGVVKNYVTIPGEDFLEAEIKA